MKFGVVMPLAYPLGGAERMFLRLFYPNSPLRTLVSIIFLEDGPMVDELRGNGYRVSVINAGRLRNIKSYVMTVIKIRRWICSENLELVISWMAKAHLYVGPARLMMDMPIAWFAHDLTNGKGMDSMVMRVPANAVLCCSGAVETSWRTYLSDKTRFFVVYPPVRSPSLVPRAYYRKSNHLSDSVALICSVSRVQPSKGIDLLLQAIARLSDKYPIFAVIVGSIVDQSYMDVLTAMVDKLGISENIQFIGHHPYPELWMATSDIVVQPSLSEGFGMTIAEAMALGKPTIATNSGGPSEIISSGHNGILVEPNNARALADAIETLINDAAYGARLGNASLEVVATFSVENSTEALITAVKDIFETAKTHEKKG